MVKRAGVLLEPRQFPCDFLLWGYIKDLVYSIPIDTTEVLREWVENAATTIHNNRGRCWKKWKNHFVGAVIVLTVTAVTLNND
jgi:hypothetical protein